MNFSPQQNNSLGMRMQQRPGGGMMQPQGINMGGGMGMRPMGQSTMMGGMPNMRMGGGSMGMGMNMQAGQMQSNNSQNFGQFNVM
jgi:hypothetical protein